MPQIGLLFGSGQVGRSPPLFCSCTCSRTCPQLLKRLPAGLLKLRRRHPGWMAGCAQWRHPAAGNSSEVKFGCTQGSKPGCLSLPKSGQCCPGSPHGGQGPSLSADWEDSATGHVAGRRSRDTGPGSKRAPQEQDDEESGVRVGPL